MFLYFSFETGCDADSYYFVMFACALYMTNVINGRYTNTKTTIPMKTQQEAAELMSISSAAQQEWSSIPLSERISLCQRFIDVWTSEDVVHQQFVDQTAYDISSQMGKPLNYAKGEVGGMLERANIMVALAPEALAAQELPKDGFVRRIVKEPVGVVVTVATHFVFLKVLARLFNGIMYYKNVHTKLLLCC